MAIIGPRTVSRLERARVAFERGRRLPPMHSKDWLAPIP